MTQPTPPSGTGDAHAAGPRWRRITAGVLLGLAILAIVLGPIMLYVRSQLLDSASSAAGRRRRSPRPTFRTTSPTP